MKGPRKLTTACYLRTTNTSWNLSSSNNMWIQEHDHDTFYVIDRSLGAIAEACDYRSACAFCESWEKKQLKFSSVAVLLSMVV